MFGSFERSQAMVGVMPGAAVWSKEWRYRNVARNPEKSWRHFTRSSAAKLCFRFQNPRVRNLKFGFWITTQTIQRASSE